MAHYYNPYERRVSHSESIDRIKYAQEDFVIGLYQKVDSKIDKLDQENVELKTAVSRLNDKTWDMYYELKNGLNFLENKLYSAPTVAKRRRRVTICANGQKVEVIKGD